MTEPRADQATVQHPGPPAFEPHIAAELEAATADINDTYSDTVALLARFAGQPPVDVSHAVEAAIQRVDPTGADVAVELTNGRLGRTRLAFDGRPRTLEQVQAELYRLISRARAVAGDTVPITRLERETAATVGLATFVTTVAAVSDIAPGLRQITFAGGLADYTPLGGDEFLYVMVPRTPRMVIDDGFRMERFTRLPQDRRPAAAYYTVRRSRPQTGELDMWFVLHDHGGALSNWSARAKPGDRAALWGPRRAYDPPADTTSLLLVGDETALGAIAAILEERDPDQPAHVVVETGEPDHLSHVPGGTGITMQWVGRDGGAPGTGTRLLDAVRDLDLPTRGLYAFGAAESRQIAAVRSHLRQERGMPARQVRMTGYWRRDR